MLKRPCILRDLGTRDYGEVYELQRELLTKKKMDENVEDALILVEHPDVYTFGRQRSEARVAGLPEPHFFIERGGEATFHNPGQLVAYPILSLSQADRDLHLYLRRLEQAVIQALLTFGIRGTPVSGATGVWVEGRKKKIASIGVAVSSWVTFHGIALNVNNSLAGFERILPCGFPSDVMTSMAVETRQAVLMDDVKKEWVRAFESVFDRTCH